MLLVNFYLCRMRKFLFILFLSAVSSLVRAAVPSLPVDSLLAHGSDYCGQRVFITSPLYVCGTYVGGVYLAPEPLYTPDERARGLADGDSCDYYRLRDYNRTHLLRLEVPYSWHTLRLGAVVNGLEVRVDSVGVLSSGANLRFHNPPMPKMPRLGKTDLRICSANIQNFFVHLGGYASRRTTPEQYQVQRRKIASALVRMDADIYALCELEKGDAAPAALVEAMNARRRRDIYRFVSTHQSNGDTISVGFIYRADRVSPYGPLRFAYQTPGTIYGNRFLLQGFEDVRSGQRLVVSLSHLRSKRVNERHTAADVAAMRMCNVDSLLSCIRTAIEDSVYRDDDFLLLGDYNSYTAELPIQAVVRAGYADLLMRDDSLGYSYIYRGERGYLDRAFASPSMAAQVTAVHPVHLNTIFPYSWSYYTRYKYGKRGKQIPYRYSDHDPLLIGVRWSH